MKLAVIAVAIGVLGFVATLAWFSWAMTSETYPRNDAAPIAGALAH